MHTDGIWFKDEDGRTLLLRGANLGGSTKLPTRPNGATYRRDGFSITATDRHGARQPQRAIGLARWCGVRLEAERGVV
jgi:hypothetical protein